MVDFPQSELFSSFAERVADQTKRKLSLRRRTKVRTNPSTKGGFPNPVEVDIILKRQPLNRFSSIQPALLKPISSLRVIDLSEAPQH